MDVQNFVAMCQNTQLIHKAHADRCYNPITEGLCLLHESNYGESMLVLTALSNSTMIWKNLQAHDIDNMDGNEEIGLNFKTLFEFCEADKAETDNYLLPAVILDKDLPELISKLKTFNKYDKVILKSIESSTEDALLNFVIGYDYTPLVVPAKPLASSFDREGLMKIYERLVLEELDFSQCHRKADINGGCFANSVKQMTLITKLLHNLNIVEVEIILYNSLKVEKSDEYDRTYVIHNHMRYSPFGDSSCGVIDMCDKFHTYKEYING